MSRWIDKYNSSQFLLKWELFKKNVSEFDIDSISNDDILIDYARLKKAITYIDSILTLIDPELCRENILNNGAIINSINYAISYFNNFQNNQNFSYIQNTNQYIDECIDYLKKLPIALPKISKKSVSDMVDNYNSAIEKALEKINLQEIENSANKIYDLKTKLIDNDDSINNNIQEKFENIKEKYNEICKFYNKTLVDEKDYTSTKTEILEANKEILNTRNYASEINEKLKKLDNFYTKIFGKLSVEQNKRIGGLNQELETRLNLLTELENKHKIQYKAFVDEIKSLLPNATSVGLAKAFSDEKNKFKDRVQYWNRIFIGSIIAMIVVALMSIGFLDISWSNPMKWINFQALKNSVTDYSIMLSNLIFRIPLYAPLIWLATYASIRRNECQRLEQEYTHKETFANSYSSYKEQIKEMGKNNQELSEKLLNSIIDTISYNASKSLNKKHSDETISQNTINELKELLKEALPQK